MPDQPSDANKLALYFTNATSMEDMVRLHEGVVSHFQSFGTWSQPNVMRLISAMVHQIADIQARALTLPPGDVELVDATTAEVERLEGVEDDQERTIRTMQTTVTSLLEMSSRRAAQILRLRALVNSAYAEGFTAGRGIGTRETGWRESGAKGALDADAQAGAKT